MFRKAMSGFTATHLTVLALGAMFAPSALFAIPSFTYVSVLDPLTGNKAAIDANRKLIVRDQTLELPVNPGQQVDIFFNLFNNACATDYVVPAGKALVVLSMTGERRRYLAAIVRILPLRRLEL